jgi:hypothetical protein
MTEKDEEALEACIAAVLASGDQPRIRQVQSMLMDGDRVEVGEHCCYVMQTDKLNLPPWEAPPCFGDMTGKAGKLAKRLRSAGVSIYVPDPLAALKAVAAE